MPHSIAIWNWKAFALVENIYVIAAGQGRDQQAIVQTISSDTFGVLDLSNPSDTLSKTSILFSGRIHFFYSIIQQHVDENFFVYSTYPTNVSGGYCFGYFLYRRQNPTRFCGRVLADLWVRISSIHIATRYCKPMWVLTSDDV